MSSSTPTMTIFSFISLRKARADMRFSSSPSGFFTALYAERRKFTTLTPGTSTGYWNARNRPSCARRSGLRRRMLSPSSSTSPPVITYPGRPMITPASVDLPDPFGPINAWTSPWRTVRFTPRRISRPSTETWRSRISRVVFSLMLSPPSPRRLPPSRCTPAPAALPGATEASRSPGRTPSRAGDIRSSRSPDRPRPRAGGRGRGSRCHPRPGSHPRRGWPRGSRARRPRTAGPRPPGCLPPWPRSPAPSPLQLGLDGPLQALADLGQRDPVEDLAEEAVHDQPLGLGVRDPPALEVEQRVLVDRPDTGGVAAPHRVVRQDLQVRHRVGLSAVGQQHVAVRLVRVHAVGVLLDDHGAGIHGARRVAERPLVQEVAGGLVPDMVLDRAVVEVLVAVTEVHAEHLAGAAVALEHGLGLGSGQARPQRDHQCPHFGVAVDVGPLDREVRDAVAP